MTRSDFDGLVCAVLLNELNLIDEITFVHPKDMQDGKIEITERVLFDNRSGKLVFVRSSADTRKIKLALEFDLTDPMVQRTIGNDLWEGEVQQSGTITIKGTWR